MMHIELTDIWLCDDCTIAACNGDFTGFASDEQVEKTTAGLERLGAHLVPDFDSETNDGIEEFTSRGCDCCRDGLAGSKHRFATLAPGPKPTPRGYAPGECAAVVAHWKGNRS